MNRKQQALYTVAKAFLARGAHIQYDQRSMDRVLELTPRRRKRLPPEAATGQYTLFLDCSGYASALYLQAFGYELPSDLTWIMVDKLETQLYYREFTHTETEAQWAAIRAEMEAILQPGDLIVYDRGVGSGHITIWMGEDMFTDCSVPTGCRDSYDYLYRRNNYYPEGGLFYRNTDLLFSWLTKPRNRRVAIHRPLNILGDPTPDTVARMTTAKDLYCALESSAPGLVQAHPGGTVTYTLTVENRGDAPATAEVTFAAPKGSVLEGAGAASLPLAPGQQVQLPFTVRIDRDLTAIRLEGPQVTVSGLHVYAHPVLLAKEVPAGLLPAITEQVKAGMAAGRTALAAAADAWAAHGVRFCPDAGKYDLSHFCFHDSTKGDVLSRRPQDPFSDLAVWSAFGGRAVITPEMASSHGMRITRLEPGDLQEGDILITMRGPFGHGAESRYWDGQTFLGSDREHSLTRLESLFGRFAWILLRPAQGL